MTSNQVMNTPDFASIQTAYSQKVSGKVDTADFSSFMNSSKDSVKTSENAKPDKQGSADKDVKAAKTNEAVKDSVKTETDTTTAEDINDQRPVEDKDIEALKGAVEEVVEKIEDELNVSVEEITEALAEMGLNPMALLIPENIADVAIELTDAEGAISLVTDQDLYDAITDIRQTVEEVVTQLTDEINVDPEIFKQAIADESATVTLEAEVTEDTPEIILPTRDDVLVKDNRNVQPENENSITQDFTVEVKENVETTRSFAGNESFGSETENGERNVTVVAEDTIEPAEEMTEKIPVSFMQNLIEKTKEVLNEKVQDVQYTSEDTARVLEQITERIRVEATPETTEINLRLHPESLGNVSVRISANHEGAMTAQFIAQNESVKAVIESQAIVLRESLEAKGVTVEAVEVMVGTHEFERNLSDSERRNEEQNERRTNRVRRINLDADEEIELEDEGDILRQDIMRQNGNTVDYMA